MNFKTLNINGETILIATIFGENYPLETVKYHKLVMQDYYNLPVNYISAPFPAINHGQAMDEVIRQSINTIKPDYYLFIDNDAIFLKKGCIELIYSIVSNKITVFGHAWQSNDRKGPNGSFQHAYAAPATLCFSTELYKKIDSPICAHMTHIIPEMGRSDSGEEITYRAKELGFIVSLIYPSHSVLQNTDLDNGCRYGMGNTYGNNLMYHASQQCNPESKRYFVDKCKEVLSGKYR